MCSGKRLAGTLATVVFRVRGLAGSILALSIAVTSSGAPVAAATPAGSRLPAATSLILLPTALEEGGALRPPGASAEDTDLGPLAQSLDALLADTAQDLGLSVAPPPAQLEMARRLGDGDLLARARAARAIVVLPSLRATSTGDVVLRVALALPSAKAVEARRETVPRAELPLRAVVLLRDLLAHRDGLTGAPAPRAQAPAPAAEKLAGRITLMTNATAVGGLVGFSIQAASGSYDPRLLYPLLVVGAGIGLGASYLASGEWEVGTGDAWFFAAGAWWPTLAGHLVFQGRFSATRADSERWVFGLIGTGVGGSLATLGLALHPMSDGGAIVAHAGGALGLSLGALVELGVTRDAHQVPFSGMGYGAALGWLAGAAIAVNVRPLWRVQTSAFTNGMPILGVLGESRVGARSAPILGLGYGGSVEGMMRAFPR
jgi:hypothetical protein